MTGKTTENLKTPGNDYDKSITVTIAEKIL
jgi:hypothetical protein